MANTRSRGAEQDLSVLTCRRGRQCRKRAWSANWLSAPRCPKPASPGVRPLTLYDKEALASVEDAVAALTASKFQYPELASALNRVDDFRAG